MVNTKKFNLFENVLKLVEDILKNEPNLKYTISDDSGKNYTGKTYFLDDDKVPHKCKWFVWVDYNHNDDDFILHLGEDLFCEETDLDKLKDIITKKLKKSIQRICLYQN